MSRQEREMTKFKSGAVRGKEMDARFDLICPAGLLALAKTYAEGATKYGDNNWLKGLPKSNLLNHALQHLNLYMSGDTSEDHLGHALWNIVAIIHFETECEHNKSLQEPA